MICSRVTSGVAALIVGLVAVFGMSSLASRASAETASSGFVALIELNQAIGPAAAEYYDAASKRAIADGAVAIVLQMDTPGGLSDSMRQIISSMLSSEIPVLGYVAPSGARAASAGTYILYASHVAAMAPATHLGAATPVSIGAMSRLSPPTEEKSDSTAPAPADVMTEKVLNDAVAYIRSLAQLRGRNAAWAEQAVRAGGTLTADEALQQHVIDIIAIDINDLLAQADGREVRIGAATQKLALRGLSVRAYGADWRSNFLGVITNPTFAYLLLLAGIFGLVLEGFHPGALLPGIVGGICLLVGLYALQLLPVNYVGLALMALGVGLLLAEVFTPAYGSLGVGGIIAFVIGSIMLFNTDVPGYAVNIGVIAGLAFSAMLLLAGLLWLVMRTRHTVSVTGDQQMLDAHGELLHALDANGDGWALIQGEQWRVHGDAALAAGTRVRVIQRDGLLLQVRPIQP